MDINVLDIFTNIHPNGKCIIAKVKFFDARPEKSFGFATSELGDIFFHGSRAVGWLCDGSAVPALGGMSVDKSNAPQKDDEIVILVDEGPKGLRANCWCFNDPDNLLAVDQEIASRPEYRVIVRNGKKRYGKLHQDGTADEEVMFQSQDLGRMREEFPRREFKIQDKEHYLFRIEVMTDGEWVQCNDPR